MAGDEGLPGESAPERADRNFMELLQGTRVATTGVQVLFAFLLTVPYAPGFAKVSDVDRRLFYVALVSAAVATLFFIAPVAQHRILFRHGRKDSLARRANRHVLIGTLALAVSITAATLAVVDYLFNGPLALVTSGCLAALATWLWFVEPAVDRARNG